MCGIVGHIGAGNSVDKVLEGLKRLEYRGYDSAGVCFKNTSGNLSLYKKTGKLENLTELLRDIDQTSSSSVGHTRWATHGPVNDINSHPHLHKPLAIVHNGIIENAVELRSDLSSKGFKFSSDTDSEVFLALLSFELENGLDLLSATSNAFKKLKGSSAFVIQSGDSDGILTIKKGAPLVCGVPENLGAAMVSSDPYALLGFVDKIFFPDDEVMCFLGHGSINFYDLDGTPSNRYLAKDLETNFEASTKGQYEHYMLKEIYEQPVLIRKLVDIYLNGLELKIERPKRLHIVGCGTAFYAGMVVGQILEKTLRIPVSVELASEFRYKDPLLLPGDLAIFISQSGETADTLAAQKLCKDKGIKTISIVNVEGSTLFREVDQNFLIHAGQEIGVASTKAFTQQVLTGRIIGEAFSLKKDFGSLKQKFSLLSHRIEELLNKAELFKEMASRIYNFGGFFFTGRGIYYPVALEGALKLKEIAYVHAEGYAAGELKHGPIAVF